MNSRMNSVAPTFAVADVGRSIDWYRDELGFAADPFPAQPPYVFSVLWRDGIELMLLRVDDYQKPDLSPRRPEGIWDAYVRVSGVKALHESLAAKPYISMPLLRRPYGAWEFAVRDPDGYVLVFGEFVE